MNFEFEEIKIAIGEENMVFPQNAQCWKETVQCTLEWYS